MLTFIIKKKKSRKDDVLGNSFVNLMLVHVQKCMVSAYVDKCILEEAYKKMVFLRTVRNSWWNMLEYEIFLPNVMCFNGILVHAKSHRALTWASLQSSVN